MEQTLIQALLHPPVYMVLNITLFVCAVMVFMMQPGFMLLEMGSVSRKNAINNVFKNFIDMCLCGLFFWWIGFDILNGTSPVNDLLAMIGLTKEVDASANAILPSDPIAIFFQLVFASTAVTITSGCVTGRVHPFHYVIYSIVFASVVYPIIAFLVWNPAGALFGVFTDFAGSVVVHAVGGFAGLAGAILLRPRIGFYRFGAEDYGADVVDGLADSHQPHNVPLAAFGVFLLWFGWYGFNAGTLFAAGIPEFTALENDNILSVLQPIFDVFGNIIANTTLAPCAGAAIVVIYQLVRRRELDMLSILNGAIAGLVGITASADIATHVGAALIGAFCGLAFIGTRFTLEQFRIDDPVSAFGAHGVPGLIAVACVAFFPSEGPIQVQAFTNQIFLGLVLVGFSFVSAIVVFSFSDLVLRIVYAAGFVRGTIEPGYGNNYLRVAPEYELEGLDQHLHGRDAYNIYENA
ncbi:MAG: hypothetical protein MRY63_01280 [Neomegalonema sp.]|nr:hypothetical protein [Neomegalonema sp.]